jgi:hypothetical protein
MDVAAYVLVALGGIILAFAGLHGFENKSVTVVSFGIGSILVIVGGCFYWQDALWKKDAAKIAVPVERPRVVIEQIGLTHFEVGNRPVANITFKNSGRRPALELMIESAMQTTLEPLTGDPPRIDAGTSPSTLTLPPDGKVNQAVPLGAILDEIGLNALKGEKQLFLYVHGIASYKDESDKSHTFRFCFRYHPNEDNFGVTPFHNDSD